MAPGTDLVDGKGLEPEIRHQFTGTFLVNPPGCKVFFIIRPEVLIHSAVRKRVPVRFDLQHKMDKPQRLDRLIERLSRLIGHFSQDACHLGQLFRPLRRSLCSHLFCQRSIPPGKISHGSDDDQDALIEIVFFQRTDIRQIKCRHAITRLLFIGLQSLTQDLFVLHCDMRISGSEISLCFDDTKIVKHPAFRRDRSKTFIQQRIVFPEGIDLAELIFGLLRYIEYIPIALFKLVQLTDHPVHRVFREDWS